VNETASQLAVKLTYEVDSREAVNADAYRKSTL